MGEFINIRGTRIKKSLIVRYGPSVQGDIIVTIIGNENSNSNAKTEVKDICIYIPMGDRCRGYLDEIDKIMNV